MRDNLGIDPFSLPESLRQLLKTELDEGEKLLWLDQPLPGLFAKQYLPLMLFGIPFGGFAVFWTVTAASMGNGDKAGGLATFFPLFGIPFMCVGLSMLCSPLYGRWQAGRSAYALTDRRAVLFEAQWNGVTVRSFKSSQLGEIERHQRADGSGDLIFAHEVSGYSDRHQPNIKKVGIKAVRNVKQVEDLIEKVVAAHAESA